MNDHNQSLETLQDIKRMMERSSRFISLSGFSGVAAGICALIGAFFAHPYYMGYRDVYDLPTKAELNYKAYDLGLMFHSRLFWIAAITFIAALISAFIFTYIKSTKEAIPIWGKTAQRLILSVSVPLFVGAIFIIKLMQYGTFGLVAPGCLLFYGLALVNASRYTLGEIKYLGYCQIIIGLISLGFVGYGIYFWAVGFGVMHIVYGGYMWWKYERGA